MSEEPTWQFYHPATQTFLNAIQQADYDTLRHAMRYLAVTLDVREKLDPEKLRADLILQLLNHG